MVGHGRVIHQVGPRLIPHVFGGPQDGRDDHDFIVLALNSAVKIGHLALGDIHPPVFRHGSCAMGHEHRRCVRCDFGVARAMNGRHGGDGDFQIAHLDWLPLTSIQQSRPPIGGQEKGAACRHHPSIRLTLAVRADVAELVDAPDLGSGVLWRGSSSLPIRTIFDLMTRGASDRAG